MPMDQFQAQNSSNAFYLAYHRCMEQRSLPDGKIQFLVVPAIVCAALSVELGFKALVLRAGGRAHGHDLKQLFSALGTSIQQQIISAVDVAEGEFESSLAEASNAFVQWRYIHEKVDKDVMVNGEFLSKLATATQDALSK